MLKLITFFEKRQKFLKQIFFDKLNAYIISKNLGFLEYKDKKDKKYNCSNLNSIISSNINYNFGSKSISEFSKNHSLAIDKTNEKRKIHISEKKNVFIDKFYNRLKNEDQKSLDSKSFSDISNKNYLKNNSVLSKKKNKFQNFKLNIEPFSPSIFKVVNANKRFQISIDDNFTSKTIGNLNRFRFDSNNESEIFTGKKFRKLKLSRFDSNPSEIFGKKKFEKNLKVNFQNKSGKYSVKFFDKIENIKKKHSLNLFENLNNVKKKSSEDKDVYFFLNNKKSRFTFCEKKNLLTKKNKKHENEIKKQYEKREIDINNNYDYFFSENKKINENIENNKKDQFQPQFKILKTIDSILVKNFESFQNKNEKKILDEKKSKFFNKKYPSDNKNLKPKFYKTSFHKKKIKIKLYNKKQKKTINRKEKIIIFDNKEFNNIGFTKIEN